MDKKLIYDDAEYSDEGFLVPFGVVKKNLQNKVMTIEFWIAGKNIVNIPKTSFVQRKDYSTDFKISTRALKNTFLEIAYVLLGFLLIPI